MKNKSLILYRSKSGHAKEYAELFHKHVESDIEEFKGIKESHSKYKEIYYFGGLYIGGINGFKKFKKNIKDDQIIHVFPVGACPGNKSDLEEINRVNFEKDELKRFHIKYLRGGFDFSKCNLKDKFLMTLLKWKLKSVKNPTSDQKGLLNSYEKPLNFVSEQKVLDYLNKTN